jgi:hypothetical protein
MWRFAAVQDLLRELRVGSIMKAVHFPKNCQQLSLGSMDPETVVRLTQVQDLQAFDRALRRLKPPLRLRSGSNRVVVAGRLAGPAGVKNGPQNTKFHFVWANWCSPIELPYSVL